MNIIDELGLNDVITDTGKKIRVVKKRDKLPAPCLILGDYNYSPIMECLVCVVEYKGLIE